MDRNSARISSTSPAGGQPLLWQHLFWMFGHPWVYAIVLPAMGMVSDGLPVFCRRPLVGYTAVALATVATMVLGFGVWVHHMFATGLPGCRCPSSAPPRIIITVPSAVGVFAWLATIWTGRPVFTTAVPVLRQLHRAVHHRRRQRLHDRLGAGRLAADRHLFRGRAPPLRADRHQRLSGGRRDLFLVSQNDRAR